MSADKFKQCCAGLIGLLEHSGHRAAKFKQSLDEVPQDKQLFLIATSSAEVMLHTISIMAAGNYLDARTGLRALDLEKRLSAICSEMRDYLDD